MARLPQGKTLTVSLIDQGSVIVYEMRREWNGSLVGPDEYESKHPQLDPPRHITDAEAIRDARLTEQSLLLNSFLVLTHSNQEVQGLL